MNKEPIGLYIFRFILGFALFAFMMMLYWSTLLIEKDLKYLQNTLNEIKEEIEPLKESLNRIQGSASTQMMSIPKPFIEKNIANSESNILKPDPFYSKTLPKILPKGFKPQGTFKRASLGKPNNLHPFNNWSHISEWKDLCSLSLAKMEFGKYESLSPDMALRIEEKIIPETDIPEFWVFLRDNVFWAPLEKKFFSEINLAPHFFENHQVTAEDFKFYIDAILNPYVQEPGAIALRTFFKDIKEIEIIDKLTFVVRWKTNKILDAEGKSVEKIKYIAKYLTGSIKPLASFVYKYFYDGKKIVEDDDKDTYLTNSVWAQNFAMHWAKNIIPSCGPWLFDGLTDREIRFKRNPNFYFQDAALGEKIVYQIKSSPESLWQSFKNGDQDSYIIQPDQLNDYETFLNSNLYRKQADKGLSINRLDYLARNYYYIGWNMAKPYFNSKKIRQALTMAIDRQRIIQQNLNGLGDEITGPFFKYSPSNDPSIKPWPYDPLQAKRILEEEGWFDSNRSGVVSKEINGKQVPFAFSLTYYVKSTLGKAICEYIATALKEIGVQCDLNGVDLADLSSKFESKDFDALYMGWSGGTPPEDPTQLWHSSGATQQGSSNMVGFANKEADKIIEDLQYEDDIKKRIKLYHEFDAILHEEQPYTFLYSPNTSMLYRNYLQNVFVPIERQDLIPGANVSEPDSSIFWISNSITD